MNTYYELIKQLKTIFEEGAVGLKASTVTMEEDYRIIDNYKKNLFPLVHIEVADSPFIGVQNLAAHRFNVIINVLEKRDINKEEVNDKFWSNDNKQDNANKCYAILRVALNKMVKDTLNTDITIESASPAIPVIYAHKNLLDGWQQTWTIDVPDKLTTVC